MTTRQTRKQGAKQTRNRYAVTRNRYAGTRQASNITRGFLCLLPTPSLRRICIAFIALHFPLRLPYPGSPSIAVHSQPLVSPLSADDLHRVHRFAPLASAL